MNRGGAMPYGDKTPPDDIKFHFGLSKGAFKRALGKLMKEEKISGKMDGHILQTVNEKGSGFSPLLFYVNFIKKTSFYLFLLLKSPQLP